MKTNLTRSDSPAALTALEIIVVVASCAMLLLIVLFLAGAPHPKARASRINCVSQLKSIGLSMRLWANDHGDKFPWQASMETNGTMELAESPAVFRHFTAISNELSTPKGLRCLEDRARERATTWDQFSNKHLSYFVGLEADELRPQTILSGDRNVRGGHVTNNTVMRFESGSKAVWTTELHNRQGNLGLADGSVPQATEASLHKQIQIALASTNVPALRFAIPKPN